ncbi:MAG: TraR/DksA family transcriptional regulator [Sphingosinicella sp.]|uniref:TraR/DksA family transcriptional regulator n=1 Tax=Sphingosinicella sp. TaxID=1917971 RepID=UPI004037EA29
MSAVDRAALRARFEADRAALVAEDANAAADREVVELDQQSVGRLSRMDAMQVREMAMAQQARRRAAIARIDAALARLNTDEFGWCLRCGEAIAPARLDNDPAVTLCLACASA